MLDLDAFGDTYDNQRDISRPVMSGDGEHVAWVWDADHSDVYTDYGFVWGDLENGRTLEEPGVYPYGLDILPMDAASPIPRPRRSPKTARWAMDVSVLDTTTSRAPPRDALPDPLGGSNLNHCYQVKSQPLTTHDALTELIRP